jgi:hypothetical protein
VVYFPLLLPTLQKKLNEKKKVGELVHL